MEDNNQLGYLTGILEGIRDDIKEHKDSSNEWRTKTDSRLQKMEDELSMYNTIYKTIKWIGMSLIAVATFKWASVAELWHVFKGP